MTLKGRRALVALAGTAAIGTTAGLVATEAFAATHTYCNPCYDPADSGFSDSSAFQLTASYAHDYSSVFICVGSTERGFAFCYDNAAIVYYTPSSYGKVMEASDTNAPSYADAHADY
jgi:hypothetical protein